jgi:16S rRNA processing protein RimM
MDEKLVSGIVRSSHGVKGYVKITTLSGEVDHFTRLEELVIRRGTREVKFQVTDVRPMGKSVLVKCHEIDQPETWKQYHNWEVVVDRGQAAPLHENEYYASDLIGCVCIDAEETVGTVLSICEGNKMDFLEIKTENDKIFLVPFQERFVGQIDLKERSIQIKNLGML